MLYIRISMSQIKKPLRGSGLALRAGIAARRMSFPRRDAGIFYAKRLVLIVLVNDVAVFVDDSRLFVACVKLVGNVPVAYVVDL